MTRPVAVAAMLAAILIYGSNFALSRHATLNGLAAPDLAALRFGVAGLLLLPLDSYSRRTYISENALLPGQVHTYFGGSEQHVFRAYKEEVAALSGKDTHE